MEGVIAAAARRLRLAVRAAPPPPPVILLSHPHKPDLCAALVRSSSSSSSTDDRLVFQPTNRADASQQFQLVDDDSQQGFQLYNSKYGVTITIGHLQSLMMDPSFFHPVAWPSPACWKAVTIEQQDTGDEVPGVVFANALKSEVLTLKIAQFMGDDEVAAMQSEDDEGHDDAAATSTRSTIFRCF